MSNISVYVLFFFYGVATLVLAFIAGFGFRKGWDLAGRIGP